MSIRLKFLAAGLALCLVLGVILSVRGGSTGIAQPTPMPLVLRQVQDLGELHTVRYTYQNVFEHHTARTPEEWTHYVPGLSGFVQASTRNEALVGMTGSVEAGIDLSKASLGSDGSLVLPAPKLYRPHVDARVHSHRRGVFWSDSNIALRAVDASGERIRAAAVKQGILEQAKSNAKKQIAALVPSLGDAQIVFAD